MKSDIDQILTEKGVDALLLVSESYKDANMYYLTKFLAPDPFILIKKIDDTPMIVVNAMEFQRAKKESLIKDVRSFTEYNHFRVVKAAKTTPAGEMRFVASVVEQEIKKESLIAVDHSFPAFLADFLRGEGFTVSPYFDLVERARETKDPNEIKEIVAVQRTAEKVTSEVIEMISSCDVNHDGTLAYTKEGTRQLLTVGKLKAFIRHAFLDQEIFIEDPIVACGSKSAMPHYAGEPNDILKSNQPIVLDIFPRSLQNRYTTDMTRTVVKGKASKEIKKMFDAVLEARNVCLDALCAGVPGNVLFNLCCDVLENAGYKTIRGGRKILKGFIHGLGHGIGLTVHENPMMNETYRFPLNDHAVVTVEPGLYDPQIGGVRIEDVVEITKLGYQNLTKMPIQLEI